MKWIPEKLDRHFRRPWFAVVVTLGIVITGLLGSVYSKDIAASIPLRYITDYPTVIVPAFWIVLALSALLFWTQYRSVDRARAENERQVVEQAKELKEAIRTMPPPMFLKLFGQVYRECDRIMWDTLGTGEATKEDLIVAIRGILQHCCRLACYFDQGEEDRQIKYAANIMLFAYPDHIPEAERKLMEQNLRFVPSETSIDKFHGVLFLRTDLSSVYPHAATESNPESDAELIPLVFGIPQTIRTAPEGTGGERWRVLPGAPMAFCMKRTQIAPDTRELLKWCDEEGDFTEEVKLQLRNYFQSKQTPTIGSFISSHLAWGEGDDEEEEEVPIGVLNIHSPEPGLLRGRTAARRMFTALSRPLRLMLVRLLEELREAEFGERGFWHIVPEETSGS